MNSSTDMRSRPVDPHSADPDYRSVSGWAILALLLGLGSVFALAHPILWCLPIVAVIVGLYAVRRTSDLQAALAGRSLAIAGVLAAVFFGGWAVANKWMARRTITHQARTLADHWVELIQQGNLPRAHQWTKSTWVRSPPDTVLDDVYAETVASRELKKFFSEDPARRLSQSEDVPAQFVRTESIAGGDAHMLFAFRYRLAPDGAAPRDFIVVVDRTRNSETGLLHWKIASIGEATE